MRQAILSIIFFAVVIIAGIFVYQYFTGGPEVGAPATAGAADERLAEYRKIKTLRPDLSVLADPFFKSLFSPAAIFDTGPAQPAVTPGRPNPFAPF